MKVFLSKKLLESPTSNFATTFTKTLFENGVTPVFLDGTKDLWIRDVFPISLGGNNFVQLSLTRDYYYQKDRHKRTNPTPICKELGIDPIIPIYNGMPIYLDGGNVILSPNGKKAIITDKVFADNDIPREILSEILHDVLLVEQIIFLPQDKTETSGHADGMVRFVDEHNVVANDYSMADVPKSFRDRFYGTLKENGLDVLLVPYHPVSLKIDGYWSAAGCYINLLQVQDKIFLPTFSDSVNDKAAIQRFGEIFGATNVIPVQSLEISRGGGVLNCLSWEIRT